MNFLKKILKEIILSILPAFVIVFIITRFIFILAFVNGSSMLPTLSDGSFLILGKISLINGVERFSIITTDTYRDDLIIKRIIGLPNEHIEYKNNVLYVNGVAIEEPFDTNTITKDFKIQLNDDQYFIMGDNRSNSIDSRNFGSISYDDILTEGIWLNLDF